MPEARTTVSPGKGLGAFRGPVGILASLAILLTSSAVPYTAPDLDLDLDHEVTVGDLQCMVLVWKRLADPNAAGCATSAACKLQFGPEHYCRPGNPSYCLPACIHPEVSLFENSSAHCTNPSENSPECLGKTAKKSSDLNCDNEITSADLALAVSVLMGKTGGAGTSDVDSDGKLNFCDDDSDGDGTPDTVDCEPLNPEVSGDTETCNGVDDNCNGEVDEGLGTITCGIGQCQVTIPACENGVPGDCQGQGQGTPEVCDGKDNDCDGKVDEEGALLCTNYYADKDADGWGSQVDFKCLCGAQGDYKQLTGQDCYDDNALAYPFQFQYFTFHRGDGSFDYNCNSMHDYQFPDMFYCNGSCSFSTPGWYILKPQCGHNGLYATYCLNFMGICDIGNFQTPAACK